MEEELRDTVDSLRPHILHVFPSFGIGGAEVLLTGVINALGRRFRHSILSIYGDYSAAARLVPELDVATLGPFDRGNGLLVLGRMRRLLRDVRPQLVATYHWGAFDMILGGRPLADCPFIHNEHGFGDDEETALKLRRVWTRRFTLNTLFTTIVPSETMARIARDQFRVRPERLTLIRNGIDTERFQPGRDDAARRRLGIGGNELVFCFAGALRREKNLALLVNAYLDADIANSRLLIVGDGDCRRELESLAAARSAGDRVVLAGHTDDVREALRAADVFVMSSNTEQASMALLEAMATGLPCVTTEVGDSPLLLDATGPPFVVPRGDRGRYAEALTQLALRPELRVAAGRANRRRVLAHYTSSEMVARYEETWTAAVSR